MIYLRCPRCGNEWQYDRTTNILGCTCGMMVVDKEDDGSVVGVALKVSTTNIEKAYIFWRKGTCHIYDGNSLSLELLELSPDFKMEQLELYLTFS